MHTSMLIPQIRLCLVASLASFSQTLKKSVTNKKQPLEFTRLIAKPQPFQVNVCRLQSEQKQNHFRLRKTPLSTYILVYYFHIWWGIIGPINGCRDHSRDMGLSFELWPHMHAVCSGNSDIQDGVIRHSEDQALWVKCPAEQLDSTHQTPQR